MNKKISTLMAGGFLLTSVFASAQLTLKPADLKIAEEVGSGPYLVVQSADDKIDENDRVLSVVADKDGNLTYKAYKVSSFDGTTVDLEEANVLWTVGKEDMGLGAAKTSYYTLKNTEANVFLSHDGSMNLIKTVADSKTALDGADAEGTKDVYSYFMTATTSTNAKAIAQGGYLYTKQSSYQLLLGNLSSSEVSLGTQNTGAKLYFCVYAETKADIADLNDVMGGEGFALTFEGDDEYENNILKDLNLKAFEVKTPITMGAGTIPAGIYLATDYPESLIGTNEIKTKADFEACTFIAVDPDANYDIHEADRAAGIGFEFKTVKGDDFNYYKGSDKKELSEKGEVYIGNANFSIVIPNPLTEPESYQLKLADIRVLAKATDTQHTNKGPVYLGTIKDQNKNYLLTNNEGVALETTNSTLYYPTGLLNATDAPAIYTIKFVSGEEKVEKEQPSEYNEYLIPYMNTTVSRSYIFATTAQANENDPMYQFVINSVDTDNRTVTFYNRLTKAKIALSLYHSEEDADNVYTVFVANEDNKNRVEDIYVEEVSSTDDKVLDYSNTVELHKTKILLNKIDNETIDKFAGFMNREEGAGVVKFRLARTAESEAVFYAGAKRDKDDKIASGNLRAWEDYADNFELIKSEDSLMIFNDYVYLYKDDESDNTKDVWRKSVEKDTVAFYTYTIKLFNDDKDLYMEAAKNGNPGLTSKESDATDFIIKENVDGSVALINAGAASSGAISYGNNDATAFMEVETQYAYVIAKDDDETAWEMTKYLARENTSNLLTFIEEETGAISLEPVAQHVSFEASEGGYVSAKDGEGKIAIATEVSDDLKFWVEPQDANKNIPSFYIANAGRYMYYAQDSADFAVTNRDKYTFGADNANTKLIFKAGKLIDANTLQTMIENKPMNVTEKGNSAKTEVSGLNNFLYQIIKFDASSDEYVIRNVGNHMYVRNINGQLTLTTFREDALQVTVTTEETPTANDEISTSEVKVIAGAGQITIAGAAGKKVVVSNILGQVVANTVITSDNATIAAPQGIVVVAVEGEEAVKAIVK